jgi:arylamine N-acetyltransferase
VDTGEDANEHIEVESKQDRKADYRANLSTEGSTACSLCNFIFSSVEAQRSHIRSDLHGYNLKQKLKGLPSVSENEFERLVGGDTHRSYSEALTEILQILMKAFRVLTHPTPKMKKRGIAGRPL